MMMRMNRTWIPLAIISILLLSTISISGSNAGPGQINGVPGREYTIHDPILIENSTHLQDVVSDLGLSGSGTSGDPYIIEDLEIDGKRSTPCIRINLTDEHILVRNCMMYDGGDPWYTNFFERSVYINYVDNLRIEDCVLDTAIIGRSNNLELKGISWQTGNGTTVGLRDCNGVILDNIDLASKRLSITNCGGLKMTGCTVSGSRGSVSIYSSIYGLDDNYIIDCTFSKPEVIENQNSLAISNPYNTHIYSCKFLNTYPDVYPYCDVRAMNTLDIAANNTVDGKSIHFYGGDDLEGLTIPGNGGYYLFMNVTNLDLDGLNLNDLLKPVTIVSSNNVKINDCSISNSTILGVEIVNSDDVFIENSSFTDNPIGIHVRSALDTTIKNSEFIRCGNGTRLSSNSPGTPDQMITDSSFIECDIGIYGSYISRINVMRSLFNRCGLGIELGRCLDGIIFNNTFKDGIGSAIDMKWGCVDNTIYWNRFLNNAHGQTSQVNDSSDKTDWYESTMMEGNYWSDHRSPDSDMDGIVDDPYAIVEGEVWDKSPLVDLPGTKIISPENLTVNVKDRVAILKWELQTSEFHPVITGFRILKRETGNSTNIEITADPDSRSYRDTDVSFGKEYQYSIFAFNSREISEYKGPVSTFVFDRPGIPDGFSYTTTREYLNLSWDHPDYDGGTPITGYRIYRSTSPIVWAFIDETDTNFYHDNETEIGQTYYYFVSSVNIIGEGEMSGFFEARYMTEPDPPTISVESTGSTYIRIGWTEPDFIGGYPLTGFNIYRGSDEDSLELLDTVSSQNSSFNDTGLDEGDTFFYSITALNGVGESFRSEVINVTVGMIRPDLPRPSGLKATPGNGYVILTFVKPEVPSNLFFLQHRIYRKDPGSDFKLIGTTATENHRDSSVVNGLTYEYRISSEYTSGESGFSNVVNATPLSTIDPYGPPLYFSAEPGSENVTLRWNEPDDPRKGSLTEFKIFRSSEGGEPVLLVTVGAETRAFIDITVKGGSNYSYYIMGVYLNGVSDLTGPVTATPLTVDRVPSEPSSIEATLVQNGVQINWTPPEDLGSPSITGYKIYRWIQGEDPQLIGDVEGNILSFIDEDVIQGTSYRYSVSAVNPSGEGETSLDALITIPIEEDEISSSEDEINPLYYVFGIVAAVFLILLVVIILYSRRGISDPEE